MDISTLESGTVKWYNPKKGFGFIETDEGVQYFVHYSSLINKKKLDKDDEVSFEISNGEKGLKAINVEVK
ncbi:MAG: cold shock domain-containing protein [Clostridia bacterium]|jgi:CspA family cold shock protein